MAEHKALLEKFKANLEQHQVKTENEDGEKIKLQQSDPIDLTKRSDSESSSSIANEPIANLSDTDPEDDLESSGDKPETAGRPLDLTRI